MLGVLDCAIMVCQGSGFGGLHGWVQDHWRRRAGLVTRDKGWSKAKKPSKREREEQSRRDKKRASKEREDKRSRAARAERAEVDRQEVRAGKERKMRA